ncbi:hypothetical protein CPB86DRAFT_491042 [Serendipita vermifera]|nr:hypothetical protein CPB86DRAFT_491042 [Serendipita vermifera]
MDPRMPNYPYGSSQDNGQGNIPPQGLYPTPTNGQDPYAQTWPQQGQTQWNHYPEWTYEDYSNSASAPVYSPAMPGYTVPMDAQYQHFDPSTMQQQAMPGYQMPSEPLVYNPSLNSQQGAHWSQSSQHSQAPQQQMPWYPDQTAPRPAPVPQRVNHDSSSVQAGTSDDNQAERRWKCSHCPARFNRKRDTTRHIRSVHTGESPWYCNGCRNGFVRSDARLRHWRLEPNCHTLHQQVGDGED